MRCALLHLRRHRLPGTILMLVACSDVTSTRGALPPGGTAPNAAAAPIMAQSAPAIWLSPEELATRPTSGPAWDRVLIDAARAPGQANVGDGSSQHDAYTLAAALACARTGQYCEKARAQLLEAIGTEAGADWQTVSRNVGAYVIAADILGLRDDGDPASDGSRVSAWIGSFLTRTDILANYGEPGVQGPRGIAPFHSGSNGAAHEGFVHAAVAAYVRDTAALGRAWDAFRTYACDPTAPDREHIDLVKGVEADWEHSESAPCAVNPFGTSKLVPDGRPGAGGIHRIDGAIINDMRRGGIYQWPPVWSQYPWTGLEGFVPAAVILHRAGYPAFEVVDRAVLRTIEYLKFLEDSTPPDTLHWFDGIRGAEVVQLVNWYYRTTYPMNKPAVGAARTIGYSDWTHPTGSVPNLPPVAAAGGPYTGAEDSAVVFDGSGSTDPDGDLPLSYRWDFGDGSGDTAVRVAHAYRAGGTYTVTLTVTDAKGLSGTPDATTATIAAGDNQAPIADAGGPYIGSEGEVLGFDGSGSSDPDGDVPLDYAWTFGDGTSGTGVQPSHAYADDGSYTVGLVVTDAAGATSAAATTAATIANLPPTVQGGADRTVTAGEAFNLSASVADPGTADAPWTYLVAWGDGSQASGSINTVGSGIAVSHSYDTAGSYIIQLDVTDKDGAADTDTVLVTVVPRTSAPHVLVGAGDIATCSGHNDEATAALLDTIPGAVITIGDNAYKSGTTAEFADCYGPTWGRHRARTHPAPGERDYATGGAAGYFGYFGDAAGAPGEGYYSYDLGSWHIVVLNSEIAVSASSAQYAWLAADLAAHPSACAVAYWHRPYRSSGYGVRTNLRPIWDLLYLHGVDIVVNAHDRYYERFAVLAPDGTPTANGIREFIVGTGGAARSSAPKYRLSGSEVLNSGTPGVLKLTLAEGAYAWEFVPIAGKTFSDRGSGTCGQ